jgi:hypothetical protein
MNPKKRFYRKAKKQEELRNETKSKPLKHNRNRLLQNLNTLIETLNTLKQNRLVVKHRLLELYTNKFIFNTVKNCKMIWV